MSEGGRSRLSGPGTNPCRRASILADYRLFRQGTNDRADVEIGQSRPLSGGAQHGGDEFGVGFDLGGHINRSGIHTVCQLWYFGLY